MSDCFKVFITEEVYSACMSLTYTTNEIDYTAFIIGEKIIERNDKQVVGLMLFITETTSAEMLYPKTCQYGYEKATKAAEVLGAISNQPLSIIGWFHAHKHSSSTDMSFLDFTIFASLIEKDPTIFCLIASVSTDPTTYIHSSTVKAYRSSKNKTAQQVNFVVVPFGRKVFFDKIFSLAQIYHMLERREEERVKNEKQNSEDYFIQKLASHKAFERYSYHIHRFVYPAFKTLIQDTEILQSLENFYTRIQSKLTTDEKKK